MCYGSNKNMSSERIVARHPKLASADEWIHSLFHYCYLFQSPELAL